MITRFRNAFRRFWGDLFPVPVAAFDTPEKERPRGRVSAAQVAGIMARIEAQDKLEQQRRHREVKRPELAPGVVPAEPDTAMIAMDSALDDVMRWANTNFCGMGFPGYPYLSELAQKSEYRAATETTATEMTRKWIRFVSKGSANADKIAKIEEAFKVHKVQDVFRLAAMHDGFFGRGQVYVKIKGQDDDVSRANPLVIDKATIGKGDLIGFVNIEPMWTSPQSYNSQDPTRDDFFRPTVWFVMAKRTHASRLLTFVWREVPDMLKPAYNFGGLSMSQLMEPYVDSWLRTRASVSDMVHSFSTSGLATDMETLLADTSSGEDLFARAELFAKLRDNRGLMMLNKTAEEFFQFNTPLSGLSELQAQSQEQMAAPSHTPLVKLLGVTPTGLNANSEGEITVYYDYIRAQQEHGFNHHLNVVLQIIQLDLFGDIDPDIGYEWQPLEEPTGKDLSDIRKTDGDRAVAYISAGVIDPAEERARLVADPTSGYNDLVADDVPEPPGNPDDDQHGGDDEQKKAIGDDA